MNYNEHIKRNINELYDKFFEKKSFRFVKKFNNLYKDFIMNEVIKIYEDEIDNKYILILKDFNTQYIKKKKLDDYKEEDFENFIVYSL